MKGLELSEKYFFQCGLPILNEKFPKIVDKAAFGLVGSGSECYGFDDELSQDHDFEPSFCIFLPSNTFSRKEIFEMERVYSSLPSEFCGFKKTNINPAGGQRRGVILADEFYASKIGTSSPPDNLSDWFSIPEEFLFEATNGKIFLDNEGSFSNVRQKISYYPDDVRLKKLAGNLMQAYLTGVYNFVRASQRNDLLTAQLCAFEFVKSYTESVFLINRTYSPYYKWKYPKFKSLPVLSDTYSDIEILLCGQSDFRKNAEIITRLSDKLISALNNREITLIGKNDLQTAAYALNELISDNYLRNQNILFAV